MRISRLDVHQHVIREQALMRALACLDGTPKAPSTVADAIWPAHRMSRQGAAFAASPILRTLERQGLALWVRQGGYGTPRRWGWVRALDTKDA